VIVGFPNFAFYKSRFQTFFSGRTPVTDALPYMWYETPNLHSVSILDFIDYCRQRQIHVHRTAYLDGGRTIAMLPNLFAQTALFEISKI
jgi:methionine biosynthesis protein MetW